MAQTSGRRLRYMGMALSSDAWAWVSCPECFRLLRRVELPPTFIARRRRYPGNRGRAGAAGAAGNRVRQAKRLGGTQRGNLGSTSGPFGAEFRESSVTRKRPNGLPIIQCWGAGNAKYRSPIRFSWKPYISWKRSAQIDPARAIRTSEEFRPCPMALSC